MKAKLVTKRSNCPECNGTVLEVPYSYVDADTYEFVCSNCGLVYGEPHGPEPQPTIKSKYATSGSGQRVSPQEYVDYLNTPQRCEECKEWFLPKRSWHKFCSRNCQMKALMKRRRTR